MDSKIITDKLEALRRGRTPRLLDLFAGCGGISLGFHRNGFSIDGAVEIDPIAAETHALNFFQDSSSATKNTHARALDITAIDPEDLVRQLALPMLPEQVFDVIVGGPPCQAFARVGRAKLREVAAHPEAFLKDPRHNLYLRYLAYVKTLKPVAILMENVPDVLNHGGHNIAEEVCEFLVDEGFTCSYTLLNSVFYGVPQMRERMFLIAYRNELGEKVTFPSPTHWVDLPQGYYGSRQVALKNINWGLFEKPSFYVPAPESNRESLARAVSAEDALGDLPKITLHLEGKLKRGARRFNELIEYTNDTSLNEYQTLMRTWPGFENDKGIYDHVIRYLPRDYKLFKRMNSGDQYPQAYQHALDMLREKLDELEQNGKRIEKDSQDYETLKASIVPPYDPGKFPNKWRKMERHLPARTLMAHLGKDSYSHIHYDSEQARTISVREAARLQSFPDGFIFCGTMNPGFKQIGNAVPPLMAAALAAEIKKALRGE
ncbi:DNA cytosine methyltransferase [Desulfatibacillum aliphaticivorans]|uniref:DNA cytosine methyltransferase n=1 Tax=Desulfatibacillum aliphaticivorans TaxID=218208 RepID=UPI00041310FD|nr:DNA cytosine methyltransferase [Desulfatibacillum aliphaticivorans]